MNPGKTSLSRLGLFGAAVLAAAISSVNAAEVPPQFLAPRFIVNYNPSLSPADRKTIALQAIANAANSGGVQLKTVRTTALNADVVAIDQRLSQAGLQKLMNTMAAQPGVQSVEEDVVLKAVLTPNDSYYNQQWHYFEKTAGINAPTAWDASTGAGVTVAVIDTGYRPHADLVANIVGGYDFIGDTFVSNDGDGRDSDAKDPGDWSEANQCAQGEPAYNSSWHGTHVSGTIAAVTNNSTGVAGVAFGAKILPVRVLGRCGGYTSDIADGIIWASGGTVSGVPANANPAKVLSLSLGGTGPCGSTMQNAINSARSRNATIVIAAGNSNQNAANFTPANCQGVVTVAAVNRDGGRTFYSNFGANVDIAAPGGDTRVSPSNGILSTLNAGATTPGADSYDFYQGTSMATPHVSGVVALMLSANPALTPDQVESLLKSTARAFPATCTQCGAGIVDATSAVAAAKAAAGGGGGGSGSCPTGYTSYSDALNVVHTSSYKPSQTGFTTTAVGVLSGRLTGPANTNFDLYLEKQVGPGWLPVAQSLSASSTESIDYNGLVSTYRWRVYSSNGTGSYNLCVKNP